MLKQRKDKKYIIWFILASENLFHPIYVDRVIKKLPADYSVLGITVAQDKYRSSFLHAVISQLKLWGFLGFCFIAFMSVLRQVFSKTGFTRNTTIYDVSRLHNIPIHTVKNVNTDFHLKLIKSNKVDIIISSCGQIFKKPLLSAPKIACINRHTALLPSYGGVLPLFWCMYMKEKNTGVSVHYMVEDIDKGDILSQAKIPLVKNRSLFYNYTLAFRTSVDVTLAALENLKKGKVVKKYKKVKNAYFSFPNEKIIKKFKKNYNTFLLSDIISYFKYLK